MRTNGNGNGNRPPQEIQAEIERTRNEMDGTLSAIEHRLSPGQLIDQGMSYLRQSGGQEFVTNLGGQAKQNPLPVALVGIGLAWLMATGKGPSMSSGGSSKLADAKDMMGQKANAMRERAGEMGDRAAQMRDGAVDQLARARDGIETMMREQPLALGALGLALGALTAALAPRTATEDRIAGPLRDQLAEKATEEMKNLQAQQKPPKEEKPSDPGRPIADPTIDSMV